MVFAALTFLGESAKAMPQVRASDPTYRFLSKWRKRKPKCEERRKKNLREGENIYGHSSLGHSSLRDGSACCEGSLRIYDTSR